MSYKTPGVYVEEIVKFPPSVAQVETAIPAFIGYTEKAKKKEENDLKLTPLRITSMLEYENYFGFADKETSLGVKITDTTIDGVPSRDILVTAPTTPSPYKMYYAMQMYFANGGGPCYIISVGNYTNPVSLGDTSTDLVGGLTELEKLDEPTLIVFPDATSLAGESDFYSLYESALMQCNKLQDRFTIVDTFTSEDIDTDSSSIRNGISLGKDFLKYGAAYYPYVNTILDYHYDEDSIIIEHVNADSPNAISEAYNQLKSYEETFKLKEGSLLDVNDADKGFIGEAKKIISTELSDFSNTSPGLSTLKTSGKKLSDKVEEILTSFNELTGTISLIENAANSVIASIDDSIKTSNPNITLGITTELNKIEASKNLITTVITSLESAIDSIDTSTKSKIESKVTIITTELNKIYDHIQNPVVNIIGELITDVTNLQGEVVGVSGDDTDNAQLNGRSLKSIETLYSQAYNQIKAEIGLLPVVLPPSSTMAGIYARVDSTRGVWKAPANVGVTYVSEPSVYISHEAQQNLNVDVVGGKSINAIRTFVGKGNLVWGARTLAGNDNEWRYVPVRRFFNMAEESIKKATEQFVFEPNDKNTWVSVKGMISNFLNQQWRAGALAGTTPEQAFYVSIGLGETMTAQDILEGSMIVEIGMAVVRPAEFIVLKFSHKMQEV